jgi:uroporphyrinogen III methyltransferase/synthase
MHGQTILITRAGSQALELSTLLQQRGARVLEVPAIEIVRQPQKIAELADAIFNIHQYSWLILTSVNSVLILDDVLKDSGTGWEALGVQIACIGTSTADQVQRRSGVVALVPPVFQAESLGEKLTERGVTGQSVLLPRAAGSREVLPEILRKQGATVHEIHIYKTEQPAAARDQLQQILSHESPDFITFTSSSTVHNFFSMLEHLPEKLDWVKTRAVSIGPITSSTLKDYGVRNLIEAKEFTIAGLVTAIEEVTLNESNG